MVLMVFGNVILRYAFNSGIVVSEELIWIFGLGYLRSACIGLHALDTLQRIATRRIADHELLQVRESEEDLGNAR
jgi:TRAP-type C4-dicarboxylate transport system permease small subunit